MNTHNPSLNDLATPQELACLRTKRFGKHELCEPVYALKRLPGLTLVLLRDHWEHEEFLVVLNGGGEPRVYYTSGPLENEKWRGSPHIARGEITAFVESARGGFLGSEELK